MKEPDTFLLMNLKPDFLQQNQLPAIAYPVPVANVEEILGTSGIIDLADLLFYLQQYCSSLKDGWDKLEPAMLRLAKIVASSEDDPVGNIYTPDFYLNIQPFDMTKELIAIMRKNKVLVAIRPMSDFTISIAVFHPLDARSIHFLMEMAKHPCNGGVSMRGNNWEYALDMAAPRMSSMYADERGDSYLAYWEYGCGVSHDRKMDPVFNEYLIKKPTMPNLVAAQIGCYYERTSDDWY